MTRIADRLIEQEITVDENLMALLPEIISELEDSCEYQEDIMDQRATDGWGNEEYERDLIKTNQLLDKLRGLLK